LPGQIGRRIETGVAEQAPRLHDQLRYVQTLYDNELSHYGLRIGLRHARKHLGWALDVAARGSASSQTLKTWRERILTTEDPSAVHDSLRDAFDDFAWRAAA
jgi:tRNA-dihydrouridine synthase